VPTADYGKAASGEKRPSVTGVIGGNLGWNKQALMWWSNQEGLAGRNHRDSSGKAADIGTLAHAMVQAKEFHGSDPFSVLEGQDVSKAAQAATAYGGYEMWKEQTRLVIVATEVQLIHPTLDYGGTLDAMALILGKLSLVDWKSSNGTYADHLIQLAAYGDAWEAVTGWEITGGYHLCRFSKEAGNFTHHWWPREAIMGEPWRAFTRLLELHALRKPLEKLAR
jgi:hypothetical protein